MGLPLPTNTVVNISMIVGNHIVRGNITHQDLEKTGVRIYTNVEGLLLHRVSVSFHDYSYVSYNPGYSYYGGPQASLKTTIVSEACVFNQIAVALFIILYKILYNILRYLAIREAGVHNYPHCEAYGLLTGVAVWVHPALALAGTVH